MSRSVEPHITFLCIPAGLHPSMNALDRFAAHRLSMDGMHSAGMQPEGGRALFLPGEASLRDATLPRLFCGSVIGRNEATKQSGAGVALLAKTVVFVIYVFLLAKYRGAQHF
jgi:hypothetical protein